MHNSQTMEVGIFNISIDFVKQPYWRSSFPRKLYEHQQFEYINYRQAYVKDKVIPR